MRRVRAKLIKRRALIEWCKLDDQMRNVITPRSIYRYFKKEYKEGRTMERLRLHVK